MEKKYDAWFETNQLFKIRQKCISTVTAIILSLTEVPRSPGCHMKDNGLTFFQKIIYIFDNKSNLCYTLNYNRLSYFVLYLWSQFSVDFQRKWLKFLELHN